MYFILVLVDDVFDEADVVMVSFVNSRKETVSFHSSPKITRTRLPAHRFSTAL